jgi:hypothetical protein
VRKPARPASGGDTPAPRITFVTKDGRVLREVTGLRASVDLADADVYVRARVTWVRSGKAFRAWTQPVFLTR